MLACAAASGATAAALTNPLDMAKLRMQVGDDVAYRRQYRTLVSALRAIVRQDGPGALLRGIPARIAL